MGSTYLFLVFVLHQTTVLFIPYLTAKCKFEFKNPSHMSQYLINYNHAGARFTVKPFQSAFEICEAAIDDVVLDRKILNDIVDRALTEFQASNHGSPQTPNRKKISPIVDSPDCVFDFHEEKMLYDEDEIQSITNAFFICANEIRSSIMPHDPILISIEGNIGAGKSTLLKCLRAAHPEWTFIDEPLDTWTSLKNESGNNLLEVYYHNQDRWAFTFQNCAVLSRHQLIEETIANNKPLFPGRHVYITERCMDTDYHVFAKMLKDDGKLDSIEFSLYEKWFNHIKEHSTPLAGIVLLDTCPDTCVGRIKGRSREGEEAIPLQYLERVNRFQNDWISTLSIPIACTSTLEGVEAFISSVLKK